MFRAILPFNKFECQVEITDKVLPKSKLICVGLIIDPRRVVKVPEAKSAGCLMLIIIHHRTHLKTLRLHLVHEIGRILIDLKYKAKFRHPIKVKAIALASHKAFIKTHLVS